jgi:3-oxoacyl-[acyl-carrier protein] reductase
MSPDSPNVAVVTGGSRGIGKATVNLFREQGWTVLAISRSLQNTAQTRSCDVGDEDAVRRVFEEIVTDLGKIDFLVNCAATASTERAMDSTATGWEEVLRTNLIGTFLCSKYALKDMLKRRFGKIVNVSSIAGRSYSRTASVAYTSSKYGVIGLTRQLAAEFGPEGINVNCVCPSQTKTDMLVSKISEQKIKELQALVPLRRLAEPEEIARTILFLVSKGASYLNGAVIDINGGQL